MSRCVLEGVEWKEDPALFWGSVVWQRHNLADLSGCVRIRGLGGIAFEGEGMNVAIVSHC